MSASMNGHGGSRATLRLELESRPESVSLIRALLGSLGQSLDFDPELTDDLKTAISEAANNVVLHAYGSVPGPLCLQLELDDDGIEVMVEDHGDGIQHLVSENHGMGLGMPVISALADRAEFHSIPGNGTQVRMSFGAEGAAQRLQRRAQQVGDIRAAIAPPPLIERLAVVAS